MSIHLYPVTKAMPDAGLYTVRVNGQPAELDTARVSAMPFNRRWPGHQRSMDQTELVSFISLSADEPVTFEIIPTRPFATAPVRPGSAGITPDISSGVITFTVPGPGFYTVEPYGRNEALHIFIDPVCDYGIDPTDENVLYFGPGEHDAGLITLHSNQTLYLDEGAVVYACVEAIDADNIRILGHGILDNRKNVEELLFEANVENNDAAVNNAIRRHTVQPEYCNGVTIDGITIRDSLVYNIRPVGCRDLHISNVKIIGCWRYNSDGIDMHNCVDVEINNCFLRTYDDSICVKGFDCYYEGDVEAAVNAAMYRNGKAYDVFKNVRVHDCVIWNDWGKCLEIGAETRAEEICDVIFENCDVIHLTGSVLDCMNVDYADVHDVTWRDIRIELDDVVPQSMIQNSDQDTFFQRDPDFVPPIICAQVLYHHEYSAGGDRRGRNRRLNFENISVFGRQNIVFAFEGYRDDAECSDIMIRNFTVNGEPLREDGYTIKLNKFCRNICVESGDL